MEEYRLIAIVLAGACSGAILGASIPTETELNNRRGNLSRWPFWLWNNSILGIILNQLLLLIVLGSLIAFVAIGILNLANAYPLCQTDRHLLAISILVGAGLAKWLRYILEV